MNQQWVKSVGDFFMDCPKGCYAGGVVGYDFTQELFAYDCMWCETPLEGFILREAK